MRRPVRPGVTRYAAFLAVLRRALPGAIVFLLLAFGARVAQPHQHVRVADPDARRVLAGFHALERNPTDVFRWSRPDAALFLSGFDGRPACVTLRLAAPRDAGDPPPLLTASMRGRSMGSFVVAPEWRHYRLLIATDPAGDTPLLLRTAAYRPAGDARDLGVALSAIVTAPALHGVWSPPPVRAIFLGSWPLLGWLLLVWRSRPTSRRASVARWSGVALPALLAGWAAAFPVTAGYLLPTIGWPWWPALPIALIVAWPSLLPALRQGAGYVRSAAPLSFWGGLGLALAAVIALRLGAPPVGGFAVLAAGVALAVISIGEYHSGAPAHDGTAGKPVLRGEALALAGITAAALVLRLYRLDDLPAGLWRDEARHGMLALQIWNDPSYRPVYVVAGADLPALLFYLMAPVLALLGPGAGAARLVSALAGALMPLALWWAARPIIGARAAVYGAALLAWASWGLSMSRWAFPATLDHLLELAAVGCMWRALAPQVLSNRGGRLRALAGMALSGALAGMAAYAYHTGRLAPLALAALTALRLGHDGRAWRRAAPALAAAMIAGLLVLAPLLRFIVEDFDGYNRRTGAVAIVNSEDLEQRAPLLLLFNNGMRYLLMWHVSGDPNGRHHAPGAPMLDPLAGTLLAVGAGLAVVRRRPDARVPLIWAALALLPGIFSTDAPHAMRSLGALAPACMLAGAALDSIHRIASGTAPRRRTIATIAPAILAVSLAFNTWLYFGVMPRDPAVYREFDLVETAMGRAARAPAASADPEVQAVQVYLDRRVAGRDVVRFLTTGLTIGVFDGARLSQPAGRSALVLLLPDAAATERAAALAALGPSARELVAPRFPAGEAPLFIAYGVGDGAQRLLEETFDTYLPVSRNSPYSAAIVKPRRL